MFAVAMGVVIIIIRLVYGAIMMNILSSIATLDHVKDERERKGE